MQASRKEPEKSMLVQLLELSGIGIQLVASTFAGLFIGYWLDKWLGTSPYLTLIFLLFGIISGFVNLVRLSQKTERRETGNNDK
jgi:ATP synthase protein I